MRIFAQKTGPVAFKPAGGVFCRCLGGVVGDFPAFCPLTHVKICSSEVEMISGQPQNQMIVM